MAIFDPFILGGRAGREQAITLRLSICDSATSKGGVRLRSNPEGNWSRSMPGREPSFSLLDGLVEFELQVGFDVLVPFAEAAKEENHEQECRHREPECEAKNASMERA